MIQGFVLNMIMALVWTFLFTPSPGLFLVGVIGGFLLIALFHGVLGCEEYVRRVGGFVRFFLIFVREFLLANIAMARVVLFDPPEKIDPDFITYDTSHLKPLEILILTHFITLTPGTTTVEVESDLSRILIHAIDGSDPDAIRQQLDETHVPSILAFTR